MRKIENVIKKMLVENTGQHMCDSGGIYGRHYQKNQIRDFAKEPITETEIYGDTVTISISTYHYLTHNLEITEISEALNKMFKKYMLKSDNGYFYDMEDFAKEYTANNTCNTYNFENLLDQTLQFVTFEYDDEAYIILQVHGGCDVRGGYTEPQIFKIVDIDYFYIHMFDANVSTIDNKYQWYSDDCGYNWYSSNREHELQFVFKEDKVYDKKTNKELVFSVILNI